MLYQHNRRFGRYYYQQFLIFCHGKADLGTCPSRARLRVCALPTLVQRVPVFKPSSPLLSSRIRQFSHTSIDAQRVRSVTVMSPVSAQLRSSTSTTRLRRLSLIIEKLFSPPYIFHLYDSLFYDRRDLDLEQPGVHVVNSAGPDAPHITLLEPPPPTIDTLIDELNTRRQDALLQQELDGRT